VFFILDVQKQLLKKGGYFKIFKVSSKELVIEIFFAKEKKGKRTNMRNKIIFKWPYQTLGVIEGVGTSVLLGGGMR